MVVVVAAGSLWTYHLVNFNNCSHMAMAGLDWRSGWADKAMHT